ncbi:hypothetical protein BHE90_011343 [Fusarium euwallaceae]|uniref:Mid2 domain-containing protein n=1 Tax=Fusarium euwallaceae TaxID=1147111 RepID=A0A430LES7_9HYPO|nr:hypothetical protein BHE90_011343 [Fusarium euwallaceae]
MWSINPCSSSEFDRDRRGLVFYSVRFRLSLNLSSYIHRPTSKHHLFVLDSPRDESSCRPLRILILSRQGGKSKQKRSVKRHSRQLPRVSTPGFVMSNTTGQGNQPTEAASVPNPEASSPADDNNNTDNNSADNNSSAGNNSPTSANNPAPTSDSNDDNASATNNEPNDSATEASSPANSPSPTKASSAEETKNEPSTNDSKPSSTENKPETQATQSNAQPTTEESKPSPTSDNNDDSSSEDNQASASEITTSEILSTIVTVTGSKGLETSIVLVTAVRTQRVTATEASASATNSDDAEAIDSSKSNGGGGGLDQKSKVAIGVAVPIAAIALLALLGLFWWKKRKTRRQAEEERRKEVEDYAYNPNADPTIPAVGMADGGYEMREDGSSGYRGWGNTTIGSTGRKASTTMSGGVNGQAYSDVTSPTRGNFSDARSGEPLMDGSHSPEGEILGAMGPSAANNRGAEVHRGPSNASSSYSAAARSDASDPMGVPYGAGGSYYDQYTQNPYSDNVPQQAVIRDNPARRNTRIESPSHYPQQSAGISQNF